MICGAMIGGTTIASLVLAYSQALPQGADYVRILPEIVLSVFGIIVMLLEPLLDEKKGQKILGLIALVGALAGIAATWFMASLQAWLSGTWCKWTDSASSFTLW